MYLTLYFGYFDLLTCFFSILKSLCFLLLRTENTDVLSNLLPFTVLVQKNLTPEKFSCIPNFLREEI